MKFSTQQISTIMKKVLSLLAIFAMIGLVSCAEKEKAVDATINANDVTVEEGQTVAIGATTTSTAAITYTSADPAIAAVSAKGDVTGIKAGNTTITLKVAAVEGKFNPAEKSIKVTVTAKEVVPPTPEPPTEAITIDGDFSDWPKLEAGTFGKSVSDPDAPWEGVKEFRCYATAETVFYYIKFDEESLADAFAMATPDMHLRLCINTDGEFESGYTSYFLEGYDFIIEGKFVGGGAFVDFDGTLHQRINGSWTALLEPENGLVFGKGAGSEYEISLDRAVFNGAANASSVPMPMGNDFQTGIRFYCNGWDEFSNIPNSSIDEEQGNGYGYLMRVHTNN